MKMTVNLTEAEIKEAIIDYVAKKKGLVVKTVHLSYYHADSRDPRESSSHSATATE